MDLLKVKAANPCASGFVALFCSVLMSCVLFDNIFCTYWHTVYLKYLQSWSLTEMLDMAFVSLYHLCLVCLDLVRRMPDVCDILLTL